MGRTNKLFLILLSLFLITKSALALESEYKNSLSKIELQKTQESTYNINLYTQNQFAQTPKVIKKSDLNYYILLPETKNSAVTTTDSNNEIRSISTASYPYAGQDINNGYTKINIATTKPITFNINVKNELIGKTQSENETIALSENKTEEVSKAISQKKNSDFSKTKKQTVKMAENTVIEKKVIKDKIRALKQEQIKTSNKNKKDIKELIAQDIEKAKEEAVKIQEEEIDESIENKEVLPLTTVDLDEIEQIAALKNQNNIKKNDFSQIKMKIKNIKNKITKKLALYGITIADLLFMALAAIISFVVMLFVLNNKTNSQAKLKSKADLIEKPDKNLASPKKLTQQENDGKYFVFDKNIKQTGFCDPATSAIRKNYELTSYEPDLTENYNKNTGISHQKSSFSTKKDDELDIIQKILKEDSYIEYAPEKCNTISKIEDNKKEFQDKVVTSPIKENVPVKNEEPQVLSKVEITPESGFMCISYKNNISLMGYIFDDVFALYNFKQQKLENYDIKYRLSEKDGKNANFIVKVNNVKMLVNTGKTSMNLEVVL